MVVKVWVSGVFSAHTGFLSEVLSRGSRVRSWTHCRIFFRKSHQPKIVAGCPCSLWNHQSLAILSKNYQEEELYYEDVVLHLNQCKKTIETYFLDSQVSFRHVYGAIVEKLKLQYDGSVQLELHDMDIVDLCDFGAEYEEVKGGIGHEIKSATLAVIDDSETRVQNLMWWQDSALWIPSFGDCMDLRTHTVAERIWRSCWIILV